MEQLTNLPDAVNHISVTLQSNVPFESKDRIIISGLVGSRPLPEVLFVDDFGQLSLIQHGVSQDHLLFSRPTGTLEQGFIAGTGAWMQCNSKSLTCNIEKSCESSELHLEVISRIDAGTTLTFKFPLINPAEEITEFSAQPSTDLKIHAAR